MAERRAAARAIPYLTHPVTENSITMRHDANLRQKCVARKQQVGQHNIKCVYEVKPRLYSVLSSTSDSFCREMSTLYLNR